MLEGSHPTCHPVSQRVREMMQEGVVGRLERIDLDLPIGHSLQGKICATSGSSTACSVGHALICSSL
eukprot:1826955-Amphidinium_carterae.2